MRRDEKINELIARPTAAVAEKGLFARNRHAECYQQIAFRGAPRKNRVENDLALAFSGAVNSHRKVGVAGVRLITDKWGFHMKCISIQQPMAWAICIGEKTVENKSKHTSYRGPLLIHAGKKKSGLSKIKKLSGWGKYKDFFAFGAIIGIVDLNDCVSFSSSLESNAHANGPICYLLKNPRWFEEPIPCIGQLGIFNLQDNLTAKVEEQLQKPVRSIKLETDLLKATRPAGSDLCFNQGFHYLENGQNEGALRRLNKAIDLDHSNANAYCCRGLAHGNLGNAKKAIEDLSRAIKLDKAKSFYYFQRALLYHESGKWEEAIEDYSTAIKLDGRVPEHFFDRGLCFRALNRLPEAISDLKKAKEIDPESAEAKALAGMFLVESGAIAQGIKDLKELAEQSPEDAEPIYYLYWAYKKTKQQGLAEKALERFKKMNGDEEGVKKYLAEVNIEL